MSTPDTVLWDIGGVLLTNGWDHDERKAVFNRFSVAQPVREAFEARHEQANDSWEKGLISFDDYLVQTLFYESREFTLEAFRAAIEDESKLIPNTALPVLKDLRAKGARMGQLNNESRELNDMRLERFGLRQLLDVFLCSGYVRLRKPDPAFFRLALDVLQTPAADCVFIDDRAKNADAARALGFHAIHYTGPDALRVELQQLGLL